MEVFPRELADVISVMPAMCPNWRLQRVATVDAMMSALPPGSAAATEMVGKSTSGNGATGKTLKGDGSRDLRSQSSGASWPLDGE